jgi:VanZ family protein
MSGGHQQPPLFPHFDKLAHFSYFSAGGFLFIGWLLHRNPKNPSWKLILGTTILAMAVLGGLDEWHQTFTPGRNGNDSWDWLADLLGGSSGALAFKSIHRKFKWGS